MEFSKFFINEYQLINVRSTTDRSKQMTIYGGISFTIFTLTILTLAYFEGQVSSIYGYLVSGLSVLLVYFYRKRNACTEDNIIFAITGWLFSAGALLIGIFGYFRQYLNKFI